MAHYKLSSLFRLIVGFLLFGQISLIQCSSQSPLRPPKLPKLKHNQRIAVVDPIQPIGIDFGPEYVVAAYAHSPTNVSVLAMISASNGSHEAYFETMALLRLANDGRVADMALLGVGPVPVPPAKEIIATIKRILRPYLPNLMHIIPFLDGPKIRKSTSWIWMRRRLNQAAGILDTALIAALDKGMEVTGLVTSHEIRRRQAKALTPRAIQESFHPVIRELLADVLKNHNISIHFAVLSVPGYVPPEHSKIPGAACSSLGINSLVSTLPKHVVSLARVVTKPDARVLLLDQGRHHMDVHTFKRGRDKAHKPIKDLHLPLDAYHNLGIDMKLLARVTARGVLKEQLELKKRLYLDAETWRLGREIERARILIKDNVFDFLGKDGEGGAEDHHHEEWPLALDEWWTGPAQSAVLAWEDVQAVEDEYAERLSGNLDTILKSIRMTPEEDDDPSIPRLQQEIDAVIIVTDQLDGALLRRAAKLAVGEGVRIYGGATTDLSMAAEGAAILAFKRRAHFDAVQAYDEGLTLEPPVCRMNL